MQTPLTQVRKREWWVWPRFSSIIAMRSAMIFVLTAHLPSHENKHGFIRLDDLLYVILALVALAHIFKTAAEIAGEHAQFV